ncbi:ParB/RepB/Spo0J family partition protein [Stutzerimonas stutzeri]|uniref:ParB/RepB/Spo0J family partition protein n=1 Tax=Stutzerimonas stutzeri TaxID=316 RepID=UPI001E779117|nr:hypothetical protein [Stutzerimonas stutzeri]CAB5555535.1 Uncharacterised protein [Stutzerimonas stutzeri]CAB5597854.1 Uncharacterised protein [Stutzerimonas stutzeri]CAC9158120.1 Uncharacterised protein [Stutzerimonas stutzeri]CAD0188251.1 Hypothetical_protein [Stutzerimonas stutzeri]
MATAYPYHPYSNIFPLISGEEYVALREDIKASGQREPIVLHEGMILDGRNRYRCCNELGIEPVFEQYTGSDPLHYVLSLNLYRRQLSTAQKALIAAELSSLGLNQTESEEEPSADSLNLEEASKIMAISPRSISSARRVIRDASDQLIGAVKEGSVSVSAAELVSRLDKEKQDELCAQGSRAIAEAAKQIREEGKGKGRGKPKQNAKEQPPSIITPATLTLQTEPPLVEDDLDEGICQPQQKGSSTKLLFELAESSMELGLEVESLVNQVLDEVEAGLDMQLLIYTGEAMLMLLPKLKAKAREKYAD